jgi:hypothetical protein
MTDRTATARLEPDGTVELVINGRFTQRFPLVDLPRWLRFYRERWAGAGPPALPLPAPAPGSTPPPCRRWRRCRNRW